MAFPTDLSAVADNINDVLAAHINALETKVGVDASAVATSLDYLLKNVLSVDPGHKHSELWASDGDPKALDVDAAGDATFAGDVIVPDAKDIKFASGAKIERNDGNIILTPESGKAVQVPLLSNLATAVSNFSTSTTGSWVDITNLSITLTLLAAGTIIAIASCPVNNNTIDAYAHLNVNIDTTAGSEHTIYFPVASKWYNNVAVGRKACAAGERVIKAQIYLGSGTLAIRNGATLTAFVI